MSENNFNTDHILNEIDLVIKKGLNKILKDYMDRYNLLETTHKKIMELPSVVNEIKNKNNVNEFSDEEDSVTDKEDTPIFVSIKEMTHSLVLEEIGNIETKINNLEKKYDTIIIPVFNKILENLESLSNEIKENKDSNKMIQCCNNNIQKENIKLEIEENESNVSEFDENEKTDDTIIAVTDEQDEIETNDDNNENINEENVSNDNNTDVTSNINLSDNEEEEAEDADEESVEEAVEDADEEAVEDADEEVVEDADEEVVEDADEEVVEDTDENAENADEDAEDADENANKNADEDADNNVEEIETEESSEEEDEEDEEDEIQEKKSVEEVIEINCSLKKTEEVEESDDGNFFEIDIDDETYCTNNDENGFIYILTEDGDVGEKVGYLKDGEPFFYADEK